MGNVIGTVKGHALRKIRRFNIESRTDKFLDNKVKVSPPKPLATQREIELLNRENPDLMSEITKPNPELLGRLKDVFVSSSDPPTGTARKGEPNKPLPLERKTVHLEYGYVEPDTRSPGFLSLHEAITLLSQYQRDKNSNTTDKLALEYNLKKEDVDNMVEYFKVYTLVDSGQKSLGDHDLQNFLIAGAGDDNKKMPVNVYNMHEYAQGLKNWKRGQPLMPTAKAEAEAKDIKDDKKSEEKK